MASNESAFNNDIDPLSVNLFNWIVHPPKAVYRPSDPHLYQVSEVF